MKRYQDTAKAAQPGLQEKQNYREKSLNNIKKLSRRFA
jgi:hypothetical protein